MKSATANASVMLSLNPSPKEHKPGLGSACSHPRIQELVAHPGVKLFQSLLPVPAKGSGPSAALRLLQCTTKKKGGGREGKGVKKGGSKEGG